MAPTLAHSSSAETERNDPERYLSGVVLGRWRSLPAAVRDGMVSLLASDGASSVETRIDPRIVDTDQLPAAFGDDAADGGPLLHAAFPRLLRRIVGIDLGSEIVISVACEGDHEGPFFGLLAPTGKHASFTETHTWRATDDRVIEHRVSLDFRGLVRQLAAGQVTAYRGKTRRA